MALKPIMGLYFGAL